jgi:flagellar protein FlaG
VAGGDDRKIVITRCVCICGRSRSQVQTQQVIERMGNTAQELSMSIEGVKSTVVNASMRQAEQTKQGERAEPVAASEPKADGAAHAESPQIKAPQIEAVVAQIDRYLKSVARSLEFRVDGPGGHTVVMVRDADTGDLIRQFPGDEVLRLAEMAEEQTIVLVREKV